MLKTVLVSVSDGEVAKSFFHSDIFPQLRSRLRLVLLVHRNKLKYFQDTYASENVVIREMPRTNSPGIEELFNDIFLYSLHTNSILIKIDHSYFSGGTRIGREIKRLLWFCGQFRLYRRLFRALYSVLPDSSFETMFNEFKPDLVFAANLISSEDARLIKYARKRGVQSIGMPKGWDNLTLKTFLPQVPDTLLVQTHLMKADAIALDVPPSKVEVVGFPKFDIYAHATPSSSREAFMRSFGLDPARKLILYAGAGAQLAPYDEDILAQLLHSIESLAVQGRPRVIVRPHPKYMYRSEILPKADFWVLDKPGKSVGTHAADFEFERTDVEHLRDSLMHCDVLVHTASTLGVEAAIFDKPSISIGYEDTVVPQALSTNRYYGYEHLSRVVKTGGMPVVRSFDELVEKLNKYLSEPSSDADGRRRIVGENAEPLGGSGSRVAQAILDQCDQSRVASS